jgi:hypothetical protein
MKYNYQLQERNGRKFDYSVEIHLIAELNLNNQHPENHFYETFPQGQQAVRTFSFCRHGIFQLQ